MHLQDLPVDADARRQALRKELMYKPGHSIPKNGSRKRTNVNVYTKDGQVMTLKPVAILTSAASSSALS